MSRISSEIAELICVHSEARANQTLTPLNGVQLFAEPGNTQKMPANMAFCCCRTVDSVQSKLSRSSCGTHECVLKAC